MRSGALTAARSRHLGWGRGESKRPAVSSRELPGDPGDGEVEAVAVPGQEVAQREEAVEPTGEAPEAGRDTGVGQPRGVRFTLVARCRR